MKSYRAEVVGSLLRPSYLVEARQEFEAGRLSSAEFKKIEDKAVDEAIAVQEEAGVDVLTDGEQRRYVFFGHLVESLDGFDKLGGWGLAFRNEEGEEVVHRRPVVVEKLRWRRSMCGEDFAYLRARTRRPTKVTLISPMQSAAFYEPEKSEAAYATREAYLADIVDFTRQEIAELVRLGCTYIQIDGPQYAALLNPDLRDGFRKRGSDPERLIDTCIEMDNACISGHPGVTFALHICRGNFRSMFHSRGGYDPIAAKVFAKTRFERFLLEYDTERAGDFQPLRHVPDDRIAVLGLLTTKKPDLESVEELRRRIDEASKFVPLERLALSPQCGFASHMDGNRISPEDQRAKLRRVVETARAVWGR